MSVAQACKMEKKEPKDEEMNASAPGQTMHSLYINRIMRLSMPDDAASTKIAALANALQACVGNNFQQGTLKGDTVYAHLYSDPKGDSIYADSVDISIVLNMVGIVTILPADGALPLCSAHDVDFWIEPRAKKINVPLACPALSVRTIKDSSKFTTWVENFAWKHQRFDPCGDLFLNLNIYQLKLRKGAEL